MSYGFNVRAANKAEEKAAVEVKLAEVVSGQPVHERDQAAVITNANTVIDLLADDDTRDVTVSCNGYLSWQGDDTNVISVSISCNAGLVVREKSE